MTQPKWTKEEKEYLMDLAMQGDMSVGDVVILLNERFENKRTKGAVAIQKHQILKQAGLTRTNKPKEIIIENVEEGIEMKDRTQTVKSYTRSPPQKAKLHGPKVMGTQRNSRRGWTTADEQVLVGQWTADTKQQKKISAKLGRSIKACQTHLSKLRKHNPELHMALINRGATINVLPATVEQYSIIDKAYVWLKFRKQIKAEMKIDKAERKAAKRNAKLEAKIAKLRGQL